MSTLARYNKLWTALGGVVLIGLDEFFNITPMNVDNYAALGLALLTALGVGAVPNKK